MADQILAAAQGRSHVQAGSHPQRSVLHRRVGARVTQRERGGNRRRRIGEVDEQSVPQLLDHPSTGGEQRAGERFEPVDEAQRRCVTPICGVRGESREVGEQEAAGSPIGHRGLTCGGR